MPGRDGRLDLHVLHIERNLDDDRSGPPGGGRGIGCIQRRHDLLGIIDDPHALCDGLHHRAERALLKAELADRPRFSRQIGLDLAGDEQGRNRIVEAAGDRGDEIQRAGPGSSERDAWPVGEFRLAFDREAAGLLVRHQDQAKSVSPGDGIDQVRDHPAGEDKNIFNPGGFNKLGNDIAYLLFRAHVVAPIYLGLHSIDKSRLSSIRAVLAEEEKLQQCTKKKPPPVGRHHCSRDCRNRSTIEVWMFRNCRPRLTPCVPSASSR